MNVIMMCVDKNTIMAIHCMCFINTIPATTKRWKVGNMPIKSEGHCIPKFRLVEKKLVFFKR